MELDGLHLLLSYQCTFECDHCFVFGSPWQTGTMTIEVVREVLRQARQAGSIEWIYFEGGEPFLYYPTMLAGVNEAIALGFKVGIVTNTYWATSEEDARLWLAPLAGKLKDLTISSDLFHFTEKHSQQSKIVSKVAGEMGIPTGTICIELPEKHSVSTIGKIPPTSASVMYRGRAAVNLAPTSTVYPASLFTTCPHEDLENPGRVHIDPFGNLHICQGIIIGNINATPVHTICAGYQPHNHPIVGPLLKGGPIFLAQQQAVPIKEYYADACQLCFETRELLRNKYPNILAPDQMYGVPGE